MVKIVVVVLCGMVSIAPCFAYDNSFLIDVGKEKILLPHLTGYDEEIYKIDEIQSFFETFVPSTNVLLFAYMESSDVDRIANLQEPEMDSYILVEIPRSMVNETFSNNDFDKLLNIFTDAMHKQFGSDLLEESKKEVQNNVRDKYDEDINVDFSNSEIVKVDKAENFSITIVKFLVDGSVGSDSYNYSMLAGINSIFAKNKFITVYAYKKYTDKNDIQYVEELSNSISSWIVDNNPSTATITTSVKQRGYGGFDYKRVISKAIVIGMLAGFFALLGYIWRRVRKSREL